jgi:hypothetical protein
MTPRNAGQGHDNISSIAGRFHRVKQVLGLHHPKPGPVADSAMFIGNNYGDFQDKIHTYLGPCGTWLGAGPRTCEKRKK